MIKLRLVACERYNFRGELYEKGKVYSVGENKAVLMLRQQDTHDRFYFAKYEAAPKKSAKQLAAEAAKAAAVAAAQDAADEFRVETVVSRPDGSEPDDAVEVAEVDPDATVVVDTDDDESLDKDTPVNSEEVQEDRDDGTAVQV